MNIKTFLLFSFCILFSLQSCKPKQQVVTIPASSGAVFNPINVKQFGAKGDGKTDDAKAFQDAINHVEANNLNSLYIPQGRYYLGKSIKITRGGIKIWGDGGVSYRSYEYGWYITGAKKLDCLFEFADSRKGSKEMNNGIELRGLNFFGVNQYSGIKSAIKITKSREATRPLIIDGCTFTGFNSAVWFKSKKASNNYTVAFANITTNVFYQNIYAINAETGLLSLRFERNESEGGGKIYGKIWGDIWIANNNFEGQGNPIEMFNEWEGNIFIGYNYFEANTAKEFAVRLNYENAYSSLTLENNYNMLREGSNFLWAHGLRIKYNGVGETSRILMGDLKTESPQILIGSDLGKNGGFNIPRKLPNKYFLVAGLEIENYQNVGKIDQGRQELIVRGEDMKGGVKRDMNTSLPQKYSRSYAPSKKPNILFDKPYSYKKGDLLTFTIPVRYSEFKEKAEQLFIQVKNEKNENVGFTYYKSFQNTCGEWVLIFGALKAEKGGSRLKFSIAPFTGNNQKGNFEVGSIYVNKKNKSEGGTIRPYLPSAE